MNVIKKIICTLVTILLVTIVTYNVYNLYSLKVLHKDLATVGGYGILEVVSGSMEPTIHVGDMIIIDTKDRNFQDGNVVTFYDKDGAFITHRIIGIEGDKYITQGDNNDSKDNNDLTKDQIVGKYVWRLGGAGKLMAAFKNPLTMVMILIIGILTCVLVSTDKDGNPILEEQEKEFEEFLEYKNAQEDAKKQDSKKAESKIVEDSSKDEKKTSSKPKTTKKVEGKPKKDSVKPTSKAQKSPKAKVTKTATTKNKSTSSTTKNKNTNTDKKKTTTSKVKRNRSENI